MRLDPTKPVSLVLAGEDFELDKARATIAGYCFHEVPSQPRPPGGVAYGDVVEPWSRRRWGYLSYDCQRGQGPAPGIVDIMAPVLLNVTRGYGVELVSDFLQVAPKVREVVSSVPNGFRFWHLEPDEIAPRGVPKQGSPSRALHRAWYLVDSVHQAGVAVTHKLLHHAWPHLFPLIDNRTIEALGRHHAWLTILEDLRYQAVEFDDLEKWFETLATARGGVSLTRLRLYDILVWCRVVTGQEEEATRAGVAILS